jgi:hypothetical protein
VATESRWLVGRQIGVSQDLFPVTATRTYNPSQSLALTPGIRLGVYEITVQIGEGGMGQLYPRPRHEAQSRCRP